jgi:thioredoxin 2
MSENSKIVACGKCGAKNRVDPSRARAGKAPVCGKCGAALVVPVHPIEVTDANFSSTVGGTELPVLLDLWAAWCGPCRMIAPAIEQLASELAGKVMVGKLDVDHNPATASRFGVQSIPTLLILKDGKEVDRIIGLQSKDAIKRRLAGVMAG